MEKTSEVPLGQYWIGRPIKIIHQYKSPGDLYGHIIGFSLNTFGEIIIDIKNAYHETLSVHRNHIELL